MCKTAEMIKINELVTKRKMLSVTPKIFDPIGFTTRVTLNPKLILRETWVQKLKWYEELPENLKGKFANTFKQINSLTQIQVQRWLNLLSENENKISLHIFAEASRRAYATPPFSITDHKLRKELEPS